jgi:hypothetical protein
MLLILLALVCPAHAYDVDLSWGKNDPHVTGYRLYSSLNGDELSPMGDFLPNEIGVTITELEEGIQYGFAITALDGILESGLSNEVTYFKPGKLSIKDKTVQLKGIPGTVYTVEASQNLDDWIPIFKITIGKNGVASFQTDMSFDKMFFRFKKM